MLINQSCPVMRSLSSHEMMMTNQSCPVMRSLSSHEMMLINQSCPVMRSLSSHEMMMTYQSCPVMRSLSSHEMMMTNQSCPAMIKMNDQSKPPSHLTTRKHNYYRSKDLETLKVYKIIFCWMRNSICWCLYWRLEGSKSSTSR